MYVLVLILDKEGEINEDYAFTHDFPEMPQVDDIITLCETLPDEHWFPDLNYGSSDKFRVEERGWRIADSGKITSPYIVLKNLQFDK